MPNYLFDLRLNAAVRLDAASEAEARALIFDALDCASVNAGSWPDGSPIIFEATVDSEDCENGGMELIEVDGEAPEDDTPVIPVPEWGTPLRAGSGAGAIVEGSAAAIFRTIRAAEAQNAAVRASFGAAEVEFPSPTIRDALIYGMGAAHVGIDLGGAPSESVTVLVVRVPPEDMRAEPEEEGPLAKALRELREATLDRKATPRAASPQPKEDSTDV